MFGTLKAAILSLERGAAGGTVCDCFSAFCYTFFKTVSASQLSGFCVVLFIIKRNYYLSVLETLILTSVLDLDKETLGVQWVRSGGMRNEPRRREACLG